MYYLCLFCIYFICVVNGIAREAIKLTFLVLEIKLTNVRVFLKGEIKNLESTTINNNNIQEIKEQFIKGMLSIILFIMEDYAR